MNKMFKFGPRTVIRNTLCNKNLMSTQTVNVITFKKSVKFERAKILDLLDRDETITINAKHEMLDACTLTNKNLVVDALCKYDNLGKSAVSETALTIQGLLDLQYVEKALQLLLDVNTNDSLQLMLYLNPQTMSSSFACALLDTYKKSVLQHTELISENNLGNSALCLFGRIDTTSNDLLDEAMKLKVVLQNGGVQIQLRTFKALMSIALKINNFEAFDSLYHEAVSNVSNENIPLVEIESQSMLAAIKRRQHEKCIGIYKRIIKSGVETNVDIVTYAAQAYVRSGNIDEAIKVLNNWHQKDGVTTWEICRVYIEVTTAIERTLNKATNLSAGPPAVSTLQNAAHTLGLKPKVHKQTAETQHGQKSVQHDSASNTAVGSSTNLSDNTASVEANQDSSKQNISETAVSDKTEPEQKVTAAASVADNKESKKSKSTSSSVANAIRLMSQEERLLYFSDKFMRRVMSRVRQSLDMGLRRHHREHSVPDDVLLMVCGHMAMRGELDTLLDKVLLPPRQKDEEIALVQRIFRHAPVQMRTYRGHWRELMGLVERMECYRQQQQQQQHRGGQFSDDVMCAAVTHSIVALFDCKQESRALWQLERYMDVLTNSAKRENIVHQILSSAQSQIFASVMTAVHNRGHPVSENYFVHGLRACRTHQEVVRFCNTWVDVRDPAWSMNDTIFKNVKSVVKKVKGTEKVCDDVIKILGINAVHAEELRNYCQ